MDLFRGLSMTIKLFPPTMRLNGLSINPVGGLSLWYIDTATGVGPIATVIDADYVRAEDGTVLKTEDGELLTTEPASPTTTVPVNPF